MKVDAIVRADALVTMNPEGDVYTDGAVAVDKGKVVAVGPAETLLVEYESDTIVPGRHRLLVPGFVDCHVHFYEYNKGLIPDDIVSREWARDWAWALASIASPEEEYWHALNLMATMIRTGTTAFLECGTLFPERTLEAVAEAGIFGAVGPWCWDQMGWDSAHRPPLQSTQEALDITERLLKEWHGQADGRIRIFATSEGVTTASDDLWMGLKELADTYGTNWQTHTATSRELVDDLIAANGDRDVEHLAKLDILDSNVVLNHVVAIDENEVKLLDEKRVGVVMNAGSAIRQVKGITQIGHFPDMIRRDMKVGIGCDSANSSFCFDMVRAMQLAVGLVRDQSMDPTVATAEDALAMATRGGASVLGWEDEIGSLEAGKRANLVLFDTDRPEWAPLYDPVHNLVWGASGDSVHSVMCDGRMIMEDGDLVTIDEELVRSEIRKSRAGITQRATGKIPLPSKWAPLWESD